SESPFRFHHTNKLPQLPISTNPNSGWAFSHHAQPFASAILMQHKYVKAGGLHGAKLWQLTTCFHLRLATESLTKGCYETAHDSCINRLRGHDGDQPEHRSGPSGCRHLG